MLTLPTALIPRSLVEMGTRELAGFGPDLGLCGARDIFRAVGLLIWGFSGSCVSLAHGEIKAQKDISRQCVCITS